MATPVLSGYENCRLCPRNCACDRDDKPGFCGEGAAMRVAVATLHNGEEPPLTGKNGSGTIFFTGCTLRCPFCQNFQISAEGMGSFISLETFTDICLALQDAGAANINLVTGTHFIPSILTGLHMARDKGLVLPILWNSSGFESKSGLLLLDRFVDIYLPDLKTVSEEVSRRIFHCGGYAAAARGAVLKMAKTRPLEWQGDQLVRGVIVRHLMLPGELESTRQTLAWYAENLKDSTLLSLMFQYTPLGNRPDIPQRVVDNDEYEEILSVMEDLGIDNGFVQALEEETEWFPDFRQENPFPSNLSKVVWHHEKGFVRG